MTGHGEKLTRKQEDAIAALLDAPTVAAAAGKAGIGERTLRRWLRIAEFQSAYRRERRRTGGGRRVCLEPAAEPDRLDV
jgi:hypothetical protein